MGRTIRCTSCKETGFHRPDRTPGDQRNTNHAEHGIFCGLSQPQVFEATLLISGGIYL
ncbi:MAG: hypothetical protein V1862_06315 [Methanobacteriota archaeon]